jgi:hypothetical protein
MNDIAKLLHGSVLPLPSASSRCSFKSSRTERARINSQELWADALEHAFSLLKSNVEKIHDIDSEITVIILNTNAVHLVDYLTQPAHLPNHLTFLVTPNLPLSNLNSFISKDTPVGSSDIISCRTCRNLSGEQQSSSHRPRVYQLEKYPGRGAV